MHRRIQIGELAKIFTFELIGENVSIEGLNLCDRPTKYTSILSYATKDKYIDVVNDNRSVKVLIIPVAQLNVWKNKVKECVSIIPSEEPEKLFYTIHEYLSTKTDFYSDFLFKTKIGTSCSISDSAVIEDGVRIGNNVTIGHNTVVRKGTVIDDYVTIGSNSTIGSEGFQLLSFLGEEPIHAPHVGGVHICPKVYIGDNTCICNSLFEGETYIGQGAKIDNLVHVAHNLYIGANAVVTAHVILCGSSRVEEGAWIAPNASILNKVIVGKNAKVGLGSVVTRNVEPSTTVYGSPAKVH